MKKNKSFRLILTLSGIIFLMACGLFESPPPTRVNTPIPAITQEPPPTATQEPPPTVLPVIDVTIISIEVPASVQSGQEFEYTVRVMNIGTFIAGATTVEVRARASDGGTDVSLGDGVFRDIPPNQSQETTIRYTAPNVPGIWTIYATLEPFNYIDNVNNNYEATLIVN